MIAKSVKCCFMCLGKNTENEAFFFHNTEMKISGVEKILGIIIGYKPKFKSHVKHMKKLLKSSGLSHV